MARARSKEYHRILVASASLKDRDAYAEVTSQAIKPSGTLLRRESRARPRVLEEAGLLETLVTAQQSVGLDFARDAGSAIGIRSARDLNHTVENVAFAALVDGEIK